MLSSCEVEVLQLFFFFFFNDTATTEIYTLSLHDALPISLPRRKSTSRMSWTSVPATALVSNTPCCAGDRKSTRLNSSHLVISYAVFCLKKKKNLQYHHRYARRSFMLPCGLPHGRRSPCTI